MFKHETIKKRYRENVFDKPFTLYLIVKSLQKKYYENEDKQFTDPVHFNAIAINVTGLRSYRNNYNIMCLLKNLITIIKTIIVLPCGNLN